MSFQVLQPAMPWIVPPDEVVIEQRSTAMSRLACANRIAVASLSRPASMAGTLGVPAMQPLATVVTIQQAVWFFIHRPGNHISSRRR
jgi:hypothetical protein